MSCNGSSPPLIGGCDSLTPPSVDAQRKASMRVMLHWPLTGKIDHPRVSLSQGGLNDCLRSSRNRVAGSARSHSRHGVPELQCPVLPHVGRVGPAIGRYDRPDAPHPMGGRASAQLQRCVSPEQFGPCAQLASVCATDAQGGGRNLRRCCRPMRLSTRARSPYRAQSL